MRVTALCLVLCCAGCATKEKTYQPPDATKVRETQARYTRTVEEARTLTKKANAQTIEARDTAMKITLTAGTAIANIQDLLGKVPAELRPGVQVILDEVRSLSTEMNGLVTRFNEIVETQKQIEERFDQAERDKTAVLKASNDYFIEAQKLANNATDERNARIASEQKLHWYRMHWWGTWIAFGIGILLCIGLAFLKFTGRLAFTAAKVVV